MADEQQKVNTGIFRWVQRIVGWTLITCTSIFLIMIVIGIVSTISEKSQKNNSSEHEVITQVATPMVHKIFPKTTASVQQNLSDISKINTSLNKIENGILSEVNKWTTVRPDSKTSRGIIEYLEGSTIGKKVTYKLIDYGYGLEKIQISSSYETKHEKELVKYALSVLFSALGESDDLLLGLVKLWSDNFLLAQERSRTNLVMADTSAGQYNIESSLNSALMYVIIDVTMKK